MGFKGIKLPAVLQNLDYKIIKGSVIMVGNKTCQENVYDIDGVVLYDSFCLASNSSNVYLLQHNTNTKPKLSKIVYICGHGKDKKAIEKVKHIINGMDIKNIADKLYNNFDLSVVEEIHIMACYSKRKNESNEDMADELKRELIAILEEKMDKDREDLKQGGTAMDKNRLQTQINLNKAILNQYNRMKFCAFSKDTTLVTNYKGEALIMDLKFSPIDFYFTKEQKELEVKLGCANICLDVNEYYQQKLISYQMEHDKMNIMKGIEQHNKRYMLSGKMKWKIGEDLYWRV